MMILRLIASYLHISAGAAPAASAKDVPSPATQRGTPLSLPPPPPTNPPPRGRPPKTAGRLVRGGGGVVPPPPRPRARNPLPTPPPPGAWVPVPPRVEMFRGLLAAHPPPPQVPSPPTPVPSPRPSYLAPQAHPAFRRRLSFRGLVGLTSILSASRYRLQSEAAMERGIKRY